MQYLVSVIDDGTGPDTPTEDAAIDVFNERLQAEGYWVFAGGLGRPTRPPSSTTEVTKQYSPMGPSWSRRST
jgi:hypothetical protein